MTAERSSPRPALDYDVTIVGGGIVGLTLACALEGTGLRVAVIEAQPDSVAVSKGQAYAISLLSGQILSGLGVWDQILPQISTCREIRLSDADYPKVAVFVPQDLGTDAVVYVAEHTVLLTALRDRLQQCKTVELLCPVQVVETRYQAESAELEVLAAGEQRTIRTRLVIAADGARSPLRAAAGIQTHGWQYWQSCITCTVRPEKSHQNIAYERFWPSGPFAILPLPGNRCRIVWTAPHAEAQALAALDEATFTAELQRRYGDQMGRVTVDGGWHVFQVRLMQSDRYVLSRLALIGDAAHGCHPVGGQGLNMGIRDAAALAEVLRSAHQQGEDIGSLRVLKRYERWRKRENLVILGFTDLLDRSFSNRWLPVVLARRLGLWLLRSIQPCKVLALRVMTGLSGRAPALARQGSGD